MRNSRVKRSVLVYCSNSYAESNAANYIQSINTASALAEHYDYIEILVRGDAFGMPKTDIAENISIRSLYGRRSKVGSFCFYFLTAVFLLFTKIKSLLGGYKVASFNRNISAGKYFR